MADTVSKSAEKLEGLLGFDPAKRGTLELFKEVVQEISKERTDKAKAQDEAARWLNRQAAKEHLTKAISLREGMVKAEKDFNKEKQKFEKELGKVMNQIQGILPGKEPQEEGECKEGKESTEQ